MNLKDINRLIKAGDVRIHVIKLSPGLYGFVYFSRKGRYHIFISEELSLPGRQEVLLHEIHHIVEDMPRIAYIFGLDMQWEEFEHRACFIAREEYKKYKVKER